jgi:hypothetical protein
MKYLRMYADQSGESHFEDVLGEMTRYDNGAEFSALIPSTHVGFRSLPLGFSTPGFPNPADGRLFVFILAGEVEVTVSDGMVRRLGAGSAVLVKDTWGQGHTVRESVN